MAVNIIPIPEIQENQPVLKIRINNTEWRNPTRALAFHIMRKGLADVRAGDYFLYLSFYPMGNRGIPDFSHGTLEFARVNYFAYHFSSSFRKSFFFMDLKLPFS